MHSIRFGGVYLLPPNQENWRNVLSKKGIPADKGFACPYVALGEPELPGVEPMGQTFTLAVTDGDVAQFHQRVGEVVSQNMDSVTAGESLNTRMDQALGIVAGQALSAVIDEFASKAEPV